MSYRINFSKYNSIFGVPSVIVDEHIKLCGAVSLKVLLIILRYSDRQITAGDLSKMLNISSPDIQDAINYWVNSGILISDEENEIIAAAPTDTAPPKLSYQQTEEQLVRTEKTDEVTQQKVYTVSARPKLSQEDIAMLCRQNKRLKSLFEEVQEVFGRAITRADNEILASFYSHYGLSIEYILLVVHYCNQKGKNSLNYIEKIVAAWTHDGIDTYEKADEHIKKITESESNCGLVKSAFGINQRELTDKEKKYIDKWYDEYKTNIALIKLAYNRTVDTIGKVSFAYTDKILFEWGKKGITTPEQAVKEMSDNKQSESKAPRKASYEIDELESLISYNNLH